jgi:single-stranded-DNA-specific exonuclease
MEIKWIENKEKFDENLIKKICKEFEIDSIFAKILLKRGYKSKKEIENFLKSKMENLHCPFDMKDMDIAVNKIINTIEENKTIMIYGDYDVDGVCSVSMMIYFFESLGQKVNFYIPNRFEEGYGISKKGIDHAIEKKISLIIALDCGTKDFESIGYAKKNNIEIIVCDHHDISEKFPDSFAFLNPKRFDCKYPFKELSGCGVGFKLLQAICLKKNLENKYFLNLIDFVAISTCCDIVPMIGENRILVDFGLKKISKNPLLSVKNLIDPKKIKELSVSDLVFELGPLINAPGRIETAKFSVETLICKNKNELLTKVEKLKNLNFIRKELNKQTEKEAFDMIENFYSKNNSLVLFKKNWNKGIIGIVASKCVEKFFKPTIIFTKNIDGNLVGSARSTESLDLFEVLLCCKNFFLKFGGHKFAAGITMEEGNLEKFMNKFEELISEKIIDTDKVVFREIEEEINLSQINLKFFDQIKKLGPFGPFNMQPIFSCKISEKIEYQILNDLHIKFFLNTKKGSMLSCIGFNLKEKIDILEKKNFKIIFSIEKDFYQNEDQICIRVRDLLLK